jgi:hypothetical protein
MTDRNLQDDPLEAELASFVPKPVSLELRNRMMVELTRRPIRRVAALAGLAAAACVAIGVLLVLRHRDVPHPGPIAMPVVTEPSAPTVMNYRRAFAKSSDAVDALLASPAGRGQPSGASDPEPVRAFSASSAELFMLTGDSL